MRVKKKPIQVEAVRLSQDQIDLEEIMEWSTKKRPIIIIKSDNVVQYVDIWTLEGTMKANVGDWIIKGINGEVYPCKDEIFLKTYEIIV